MSKSFEDLLAKVAKCSKKTVSVACAQDKPVLEAVKAAKEKGIADAILVGDEAEIRKIAAELDMNLDEYKIINEPDSIQAAHKAVELVHNNKADMYMKGIIDTKNFLKSVLDKEVGLRTGKPLSHVAVFEVPGVDRLLYLSDVAFMTYPSLEDKKAIIENTVKVVHACGIPCPKVAPLAAVEVVNPKMPVTVDAAELTKMNENGEITGCIVDGPLSLDLAIDPEAAKHKGAEDRKIVGDADILLFPDIHAGNLVYKCLTHTTASKNGCILTGTKAPVILTSRSDSFEVKMNSIALAAVVAEAIKNEQ
ncbi:MAG: phosphate butyryltransferase [Clostridium sp.]|uniref:Phosphotransbutyrylase n=1 Tax=butyrate-producing bacterium L2-50 TaxID=105844 RepID=Q6UZ89_9FIRM|nr:MULTISPECIES: phosphate butyryltransferase [unclassified Clostridium]AAR19757.1 phosphotransbutyrylase [butyrate-producing bacterium L2-50]MBS6442477.1 phosphate butyryltransferase [Clostridium sp.]UEA75715.1 phosphate butyryltransferase [Lachnospiraceae bacterium GAM79]RJX00220.1 phosphate butyryltransferase [Clostridium sp. AF15-41]UEA76448.1 phosphate butyryltransferase [Lachnospiraceae bacterium GAM79]